MRNDEYTGVNAWEQIIDKRPPTKRQKHSLHRLGYSDWLIQQMNRDDANTAIQDGLKRIQVIRFPANNPLAEIEQKPSSATVTATQS